MYSKDQASQIKQAFWTAYGQYMALQPSAEGLRINWINYKTGIKHLAFKMQVDKKSAWIGIELANPDLTIQQLLFEQFEEYKKLLTGILGEEWQWELHSTDEYGKTVCKIYTVLPGISIFNKEDWPKLISFFKPRIIALDEFWSDARYGFELFK
ncbi:DUF4268 domain-containing protein [Pedobacter sp. V48]|uniref:DUF4268 domain-containing protein n=1 Tax=Pedobacter sp. V48 TaxID=509635 RepID=UPI0003E5455D|nr:DUF4268 domain-containing protein [Pedobacter sp. V48]ETZ22278.1 hypothetical protein N824_25450 [Pedobacter sp. V48]